jgi:hypothetical protein
MTSSEIVGQVWGHQHMWICKSINRLGVKCSSPRPVVIKLSNYDDFTLFWAIQVRAKDQRKVQVTEPAVVDFIARRRGFLARHCRPASDCVHRVRSGDGCSCSMTY